MENKELKQKLEDMIKDTYQERTVVYFTGLGGNINFNWAMKEQSRVILKYTQEENLKYYKDLAELYHYKYDWKQHNYNLLQSKYNKLERLFKVLWKKR